MKSCIWKRARKTTSKVERESKREQVLSFAAHMREPKHKLLFLPMSSEKLPQSQRKTFPHSKQRQKTKAKTKTNTKCNSNSIVF